MHTQPPFPRQGPACARGALNFLSLLCYSGFQVAPLASIVVTTWTTNLLPAATLLQLRAELAVAGVLSPLSGPAVQEKSLRNGWKQPQVVHDVVPSCTQKLISFWSTRTKAYFWSSSFPNARTCSHAQTYSLSVSSPPRPHPTPLVRTRTPSLLCPSLAQHHQSAALRRLHQLKTRIIDAAPSVGTCSTQW